MNDWPRVAFFNQTALYGGAERSLFDVVTNYPGPSTTVLLEAGPLYADLNIAGKQTLLLQTPMNATAHSGLGALINSLWTLPKAVLRFAQAVRNHDLIYANSMKALVLAVLSRPLHRRQIIWHLRSFLTPEHFSPVLLRLTHLLANCGVDLVIANSNATARAYQRSGGKHSPKVIYNGFALKDFAPENRPALRSDLIQAFGLDPRKPILGIVGRISPWKGHSVVFDVIAQNPDWQLLVVGEALFESENYRSAFHTHLTRLQQTNTIVFTGQRDDVTRLLGGLDIAIHASTLAEPFGRVVVEAMLAGTPIIATRAGGIPEIVEHGQTGWLYAPGSVSELQSTIHHVLDNPETSAIVALRARETAERRFALTQTLPQIFAAIETLKAQRKGLHDAAPVEAT